VSASLLLSLAGRRQREWRFDQPGRVFSREQTPVELSIIMLLSTPSGSSVADRETVRSALPARRSVAGIFRELEWRE
jgi:hypothetical protein